MIKDKIKSLRELKDIVAASKKRGKKITFTNGCFDILHLGHIKYLEKASLLGDRLIVAINSDASVGRIKGNRRPLFPEQERATLVAALGCVDYVIIFTQPTPLHLIKTLKPAILVKGGDWQASDIVGKGFIESYGGKVISANFVKGHSSSSIIARIKENK